MRPPKVVIHGTVLFITTSIEEGILLPSILVFRLIIESILARAQTLHPVRVCHLTVEGTHIHMLVVVDDPDDIKGFMERLKTESAHAINAFLGRKKRTVWCRGYDSPVLLTKGAVMDKISYLYSNAAKDGLEASISRYPGLNTWEMFTKKKLTMERPWLRRPVIRKIVEKGSMPTEAGPMLTFSIYPDAWMDCLGIPAEEREQINRSIIESVAERERHYESVRQVQGRKVIGRQCLLESSFDPNYIPHRHGRRMLCICEDKPLRRAFLAWVREASTLRREVYQLWKKGDFSLPYPLGFYPPSLPKRAEILNLGLRP